jgi:DNA primase
MRIPTEKIDEVRNAIDIVDLIASFVQLKKRGKNYVGLCPFHGEKTPSFNVSQDRQMYHCFGCGVSGNVFTFIMEYEKVSFVEAVRSLAERLGITLPQYSAGDEDRASEQEQLYAVCAEAGRFYYQCLTETTEGKFALDYFHARGFADDTIRKFGLGYSPNSWEAFVNHARGKNIPLEYLEKAGLARKREDGSYHDYFHGRAMFPIISTTGRVVGFGARKLREDDQLGKYLNSPETLIYSKSKLLYGLFHAKEKIREENFHILVEGYADLISVSQAGIKNIVASSGTALTEDQVRLISRYTDNITIVYDADSAGSKAALRGVDVILENDLNVRIVTLPAGDDPDSFVKKNGGEAFRAAVENAISFIDFITMEYQRQGKLETPEGQAETVRAIVQAIAKMKDDLKRTFNIKQVAAKYKLYESDLRRELDHLIERQYGIRSERARRTTPAFQEDKPEKTLVQPKDIPEDERDFIYSILEGGESILRFVLQLVTPDDLTFPEARRIYNLLWFRIEHGLSIEPRIIMDEIDDQQLRNLIADIVFSKYQLSAGWEESGVSVERGDPQKIVTDAIVAMKKRRLKIAIEENRKSLKEASLHGLDVTPFLKRNTELMVQMSEIAGQDRRKENNKG